MSGIAHLGHVGQMIAAGQGRGEGRFDRPKRFALQFTEGDALGAPLFDGQLLASLDQLQTAADVITVVDSGLLTKPAREIGVHLGAVGAEPVDRRPSAAGVAGRDDARAGPRRLLTEVALVEDGDAGAFFRQEIGRRQPDDAAAEDQYVRMVGHAVVIGTTATVRPGV